MALSPVREDLGWVLGKISSQKKGKILEQTARAVVEAPSLEVFEKCGDVALRDFVQWGNIGGRWKVQLGDPGGLFLLW